LIARSIELLKENGIAAMAVLHGRGLADGYFVRHPRTSSPARLGPEPVRPDVRAHRPLLKRQPVFRYRHFPRGSDGSNFFALVGALAWLHDQPSRAPRADHLVAVITSAISTNRARSDVKGDEPVEPA